MKRIPYKDRRWPPQEALAEMQTALLQVSAGKRMSADDVRLINHALAVAAMALSEAN